MQRVSSPRGFFFADIPPHLKEHYIRNVLSHDSTLVGGAFWSFGVKSEKLIKQKSLTIGKNFQMSSKGFNLHAYR